MILTAQQILDTQKHRTELVSLAEGQEVYVRSLPAHVVEKAQKADKSDAYVFVNAVVDASGKRIFADDQVDAVADSVASDALQVVVSKAYALSVVSTARQEEIKKNWEILRGSRTGE